MREEEKRKEDGCVAREELSEEVGSHTCMPPTALLNECEEKEVKDRPIKMEVWIYMLALITIRRGQTVRWIMKKSLS